MTERLARFFVNRADLTLFTHEGYRRSLLTRPGRRGLVIPASWIDERDVLSPAAAADAWCAKRASPPVRLLFAARLVPEKGTELLLEAVARARVAAGALHIDVIGDGPGRKACEGAARRGGAIALRLLDPIPYGPGFFALLRGYHAALVPSLSDEQPRIVFDAFAQAVPVIAADTPGLAGNVRAGETGWLVPSGDAQAWAEALARAAGSARELERMGLAALGAAQAMTHAKMHEARWRALVRAARRLALACARPHPFGTMLAHACCCTTSPDTAVRSSRSASSRSRFACSRSACSARGTRPTRWRAARSRAAWSRAGFVWNDFGYAGPSSVQSPTYPFFLAALFLLFGAGSALAYGVALAVNCLLGGVAAPGASHR